MRPVAHHADPVGDGQRLLLVVGDEQGGDAHLELDPADLVPQLRPDLGIERRQRLVQQQHLRLDGQRPGQRDPLLLPAGDLVRVAVRLRRTGRPARASPSPAGPARAVLTRRSRSPNATFCCTVMCGNSE